MKTYIILTDEEVMLLDMYCETKPAWWRLFFGWRGTRYINNEPQYYYKVPAKVYELSQTFAKRLGVETITG